MAVLLPNTLSCKKIASPMLSLFKKRKTTAHVRKRPSPSPSSSSSDTDAYTDANSNSCDESKLKERIKRRKAGGIVAGPIVQKIDHGSSLSTSTQYQADLSATITASEDATATQRQFGPNKAAPANVRTTVLTDYAPDVCKDYKQTGFCGFGDGCKFLHMREDYKQGWALDKDWEVQTKGKKPKGTVLSSANRNEDVNFDDDEAEATLLSKIPFACIICKQPYKIPIVTLCGHYFCEACALQRYRKKPDCAACGTGTNGVFNSARNLQKLLAKKKNREDKLKESHEGKHKNNDANDDHDDHAKIS